MVCQARWRSGPEGAADGRRRVARRPLAARRPGRYRWVLRLLCWIEAVVLTGYGAVLTLAGTAALAGLLGAVADRRALLWHAALWGPVVSGVGSARRRRAA